MRTLPIRFHRGEHGFTIIELLVSLAVFALFILIIDAVFSGARTNAKKIEVAADVQQNVRSAVYRITRELRETNTAQIVTGTDPSNGQGQIVFKSARLVADNTVFCLYTKVGSGLGFDARCWTAYGGTFPSAQPPVAGYAGTPPSPCNATDVPCATYSPLWQQYVGYSAQGLAAPYTLYRVSGQLTPLPNQALSTTLLCTGCGDVIASNIQSFGNISISGGIVSVSIQGLGRPIVQGTALPAQQIALPTQSMVRN
jgi:prepilin-type N-terminal cleavage/methylation domain-containing protein